MVRKGAVVGGGLWASHLALIREVLFDLFLYIEATSKILLEKKILLLKTKTEG